LNIHYDIPEPEVSGTCHREEPVTGFTKPGAPDVVRAVLACRFRASDP